MLFRSGGDALRKCEAQLRAGVGGSFFNPTNGAWEPLVELWSASAEVVMEMDSQGAPRLGQLQVSSADGFQQTFLPAATFEGAKAGLARLPTGGRCGGLIRERECTVDREYDGSSHRNTPPT